MTGSWRLFAAGAAAVGLTVVSGCSTGRCDPTTEDCGEDVESQRFEGAMALRSVVSTCVDEQRALDLVLDGAAASASVTLASHDEQGTETWSERHRVPVATADDAGWWEARWLSLAVADTTACETLSACSGRYAPGERTLFACGDAAEASDTGGPATRRMPSLTVVLELVDAADRTREVCYTWGEHTDPTSGCLAWEPQ